MRNKNTVSGKTTTKGVSTLDFIGKNINLIFTRILLLTTFVVVFSSAIYAGHSILDFVDPSFNPQIQTNSFRIKSVSSLVTLPDGKILAAGTFNSYNRQPIGGLIRLNANATLDTTFNNNLVKAGTRVTQLVLQPDGKIIIGGNFFNLNSQTVTPAVVRLNADGTIDSSFNYTAGGNIQQIRLDANGRFVLNGNFQVVENGVPVTRFIIRLNPNGSVDTSFSYQSNVSPSAIAVQGNKVLGGYRDSGTPQTQQDRIFRLNENGSADNTFTSIALGQFGISTIEVQTDGKILTLADRKLQRLNENGVADTSFQQTTYTGQAKGLYLHNDGRVTFVSALDTGQATFVRVLSNGAPDSSFTSYTFSPGNGIIASAFTVSNDNGVIIGDETSFSGNTNNFIRLLPTGSPDPAFNPGGLGFQTMNPGTVEAIAVQPDEKIIIGGKFDTINDISRPRMARLNSDATLDASFQINTSGTGNYFSTLFSFNVYNFAVQPDGKIIVSGFFRYYLNGLEKNNLVRLNSDGSIDPTFNLSILAQGSFDCCGGGKLKSVLLLGGDILLGTTRSSLTAPVVPNRVTSGGANVPLFNPTIYNTKTVSIFDIAVQPNGKILFAGYHSDITGRKSFIARLNNDGTTDSTFQADEDLNKEMAAFSLLQNGKILIVKRDSSNVVNRQSNVFRLNADGSMDTSFNSGNTANGKINAMLVLSTGKIMIGGGFTTINNQPRRNLAVLNADGTLDPLLYNVNNEVLSITADSQGRILLGGDFTGINVGGSSQLVNRSFVARLIDRTQTGQRARFDFDGDGKADLAVFSRTNNHWSIFRSQTSQAVATNFGLSDDKTVPADFDGDGKTDVAVYRPSTGVWYLSQSTAGFTAYRWGIAEDIPVAADYDGDGKADLAVWRPSNRTWYILQSTNNQASATQFGLSGDVVLPKANFDGDGRADIAVFRPSNGTFYWLASGSSNQFKQVQFGLTGDIPSIGDFNGDGKDDLVVYRPSTGMWHQNLSTPTGEYVYTNTRFGLNGDTPVAADYDGDGKTDIAVRRGNMWHILKSSQGYATSIFGNAGDQAVAALQ